MTTSLPQAACEPGSPLGPHYVLTLSMLTRTAPVPPLLSLPETDRPTWVLQLWVPQSRGWRRSRLPWVDPQLQIDMLLLLLLPVLLLLWVQEGVWGEAYSLKVQSPVTVQEGLCVHVPCEFTHPYEDQTELDAAHGYWFREKAGFTRQTVVVATNDPSQPVEKETKGRFHLTGDPRANNCSLDIRDAQKKDEGSFVFRMERGRKRYSYIAYPVSVRVTALTHTPGILIPGTLQPGRPSNLTCSVPWACERGTPPIFSWAGASVSHLDPAVTSSPVLTLTPRPQDHGTALSCQVTLPAASVTTRTTVQLNISYAPRNLTVTVAPGAGAAPTALANGSSLPVVEGQALRLLCAVDSHPRARLSWSWGNLTLCPSEPANPGVLELTPEHLRGEGEFTCRAQNALGSRHVSLSLSLQDKQGLPQRGWGVTGVTLGAFVGAGTTTLLFLSFCIILAISWSWRKKSAKPAASARDPDAASGSVSQGPLVESQPDDSSSHQPLPSVAALSSEEEEEIHYASLSFHGVKPRDPQEHQSITSEYSEIKFHE
ncbi:sialic acid-binding Ig-like lectin 7 isoform X1 [Heterocephalus glaber]|uniref:Sialic acid-binding Ig-like lectin 7 isoform X1 n=1 Tax=Heterocephalus glaber TaxID=10181 RepID=A0AAX6S0Q0_HETGA|nr:sialic acid-binding Ig-like lectin 7 isoform X1 [Heterocephalus glaber]